MVGDKETIGDKEEAMGLKAFEEPSEKSEGQVTGIKATQSEVVLETARIKSEE